MLINNYNYSEIKKQFENSNRKEQYELVDAIVDEILATDESLISVRKSWVSYGTWKSVGFANNYQFKDFTNVIVKSLSGTITHDEEKEFKLEDFSEDLANNIYEFLYFG